MRDPEFVKTVEEQIALLQKHLSDYKEGQGYETPLLYNMLGLAASIGGLCQNCLANNVMDEMDKEREERKRKRE